MNVRVPIQGQKLRWARELAWFDTSEIGKAAGVSAAQIDAFEEGDAEPTYRQLVLMSKKLDRPAAFFLAPPPAEPDVPQTADFRGNQDNSLTGELVREMKRAESHREAMLDLVGQPSASPRLQKIDRNSVNSRARELRDMLGLTELFRPPESQPYAVFNFWRGLLESHGYLVFQTTGVDLSVFRGLSIQHDVLPVILLNGADSANGRVFTLFHEVAHLANRTSGLCVLNEQVDEEAVCNAFAATFLMPEARVRALLSNVDADDRVDTLAAEFRVSLLAAAVRLRSLGMLDASDLDEVRRSSDENWKREREKQAQGSGFVPPWRLRYRDLGSTYVGAVAQAIEEDRVDWLGATYLLNARLPMVEQMFEEYYRTGGAQ